MRGLFHKQPDEFIRSPSTWLGLAYTVDMAAEPTPEVWAAAKVLAALVIEGRRR